jgi:hypothetical protein
MKFYNYLNENTDNPFVKFEDPSIAKEYDYRELTLKKVPKDFSHIIKMLKKHLKTPLQKIKYKNGTKGEGGMNIAVFSDTIDGMAINITNIKKIQFGGTNRKNYHDQLEEDKEKLEKWREFQKKAITPKDKKTARTMVNRLSMHVHNLESKIRKGETAVPHTCVSYAKNKEEAIELVILHELGHREKHKADLFKMQVYFNNGEFPTEYSKRNIGEYHSEVYALTKKKLINKTPISDEAKTYFRKAIK